MEYAHLTGTGLRTSKVCLGTMTFGGQVSEEESIRIIHTAIDQGVNFIDTADAYVGGVSETIVGKALVGRRDKLILATKVFNPMGADPNDRGLSRRHILQGLEASLRRLQTDYVDLYYLHQPDYHTPIEETLETMDMLVRSGKVHYVGVSNYAAWQMVELIDTAKANRWVAPAVTQNVYNLLTRGIEDELIPMVTHYGLGVIAYNPLMSGLLTGKHSRGMAAPGSRLADSPEYRQRYWSEENFNAAEECRKIAEKAGMTPVELALRWCAHQPGIDSVLLGASRESHLAPNMSAILGPPLPKDMAEACDQVWAHMSVGTRYRYYR